MWKIHLLLLLTLILPFQSIAIEFSPKDSFLVQTAESLPKSESDSLFISYNSKQFDPSLLDSYSKEQLIQMIRTNSTPLQFKNVSNFVVPFGPSINWGDATKELEELNFPEKTTFRDDFKKYMVEISKQSVQITNANLEALSEVDLREFLSKKQGFLFSFASGLERMFLAVKLKPPYRLIQNILNSTNNIFFQNSVQFVHSNTYGVPLFISTGFGSTLGRLLYDIVIAKTALKKLVNPDFGFYLSTSFGLSISRIQIERKRTWVLDLFFDFETFKRAFLPMFQADVGGGTGFNMETRALPNENKRVFFSRSGYKTAKFIPLVGAIRSGPNSLSIQQGIFFTLPVGSTFYETNTTRRYMHIVLKRSEIKTWSPNACFGFYSR